MTLINIFKSGRKNVKTELNINDSSVSFDIKDSLLSTWLWLGYP